ncbi:MAG: tetratricopeptide repeat protein [Planctomycetota bacterium]
MRRIVFVTALALAATLAGCGPSKSGLENRAAAYERLNIVNSRLTYDQAKQSFEAGQFDKALRDISAAIERHPDASDFHLLQGRIYLETHRLENALRAFETTLEKDPNRHEGHYFAAIVHQRWSDDQTAYEHYRSAADIDPTNVQYLVAASESLIALGQFEQARALVDDKLGQFEHNAALRHLLAQIALLENDTDEAVRLLAEARMLRPDDTTLIEELAWAQFHAGRYGDCHATLGHFAAATGELDSDLLQMQARCLAAMERTAEARSIYLQLTRDLPDDAEVWIELGGVAWELNDYRRVTLCGLRAIALSPDRFEGYLLKGIGEHDQGNVETALELYRQAAERAPDFALPHVLLGRTLEDRGDEAGALLAYEQAIMVEPGNPDADRLYQELQSKLAQGTAGVLN